MQSKPLYSLTRKALPLLISYKMTYSNVFPIFSQPHQTVEEALYHVKVTCLPSALRSVVLLGVYLFTSLNALNGVGVIRIVLILTMYYIICIFTLLSTATEGFR